MIYLDVEDLLHVAQRVLGTVEVRDLGLLDSAAARPQASAFGEDAYPTIHDKAAALIHSIARNHALVDGNKRLALAGGMAFLGVNGWQMTMTEEEAYNLIIEIATGRVDDVASIASRLEASTRARAGEGRA